jgi:metallo-beta-lactamase class B
MLGSHGSFFNLAEKRKLLARTPHQNPFLDPEGYRGYLRESKATFESELRDQQKAP